MAEWNGTARTNYFKTLDIEGLRKSLEPFEVQLHEHHDDPSYVMLSPMTDDGGFATLALNEEGDQVRTVGISMNTIYTLAAKEFVVSVNDIARCSYDDLPEKKLTSAPTMAPRG